MNIVPGLENLGTYLYTGPSMLPLDRPLTESELAQLKEAEHAADNAMATVVYGIAGIGNMLAGIGAISDEGVNEDLLNGSTLSAVGWLLEGLGGLAHSLNSSQSNISYTKARHAVLTGKHVD